MGVQLVVSLLAVSIMQKMAPHYSFARWLLCNGRWVSLLYGWLSFSVFPSSNSTLADGCFFQSLEVQASFRGRTLCTSRQADVQQDWQERQVWASLIVCLCSTFCLSILPSLTWAVFRRQNGHGEPKPLTVPKDIDLHLESTPVNVIDALGKVVLDFVRISISNHVCLQWFPLMKMN